MVTLRRSDTPTSAQSQQFETWRRYLRLWETGMTVQQIAVLMGTTRQAVDFRLRKALKARQKGWL